MLDSVKQFLTVINALFLREIKANYGRKRLGYFWAFAEPLAHIAFFVWLRSLGARLEPNGIDIIPFLVTGIVPYFLFRTTCNGVATAIEKNKELLSFSKIKVMDILFANSILHLCTYSIIFVTLCITMQLTGFDIRIEDPLLVCVYFLLFWLLGFAAGIFLMPLCAVANIVKFIMKFLLRILYVSSGIIFSISRVPEKYQKYLEWNPLIHLVENIRGAFFIQYNAAPNFDNIGYVIIVILLMILLGRSMMERFKAYIYSDYI